MQHSGTGSLGDVLAAVDGSEALLAQGEVISFAFEAPPVQEGLERHAALWFHGRYSSSPEGLGGEGMAGPGPRESASVAGEAAIAISGPNPFNPATTWRLDVASSSLVDLRIYDARGRLVRKLVSDRFEAGVHTVRWDGRNDDGQVVGSGVYFWHYAGTMRERGSAAPRSSWS